MNKKGIQGKIITCLSSQTTFTQKEILKLQYALELLKNEGIKTIVLLAFFAYIGQLKAFLLCMAIACTVRIFAGGMHMKTNLGCFLFSFVLLCTEILILPSWISASRLTYTLLLTFSTTAICLLSPLASFKRPFKGEARYRMCRRNAILFSILWWVLFAFLFPDGALRACGIWVLTLQALQMIITYIYRYLKKEEETAKCSKR